jgi:outer membrane protein OmpA-like peptidoglycan-associated protein
MRNLLFFLFFTMTCSYTSLQAQSVVWASELLATTDNYRGTAYSPLEVLGPPVEIPEPYKESYWGWIAGFNEQSALEQDPIYLTVGFGGVVQAKGLVVVESINPGSIEKILTIDEVGVQKIVYTDEAKDLAEKFRVINVSFPSISKIRYVTLVCRPSNVTGWNYIDGIGLNLKNDPIQIKANVATDFEKTGVAKVMGSEINTKHIEKYPIVSADGNTLYFARNGDPRNIGGEKEDIWYATALSETVWSESQNMGRPLNNEGYNFVTSLMPDVNTLLLGNQYHKDGSPGAGGISMTHRTKNGWAVPTNITIANFQNFAQYSSYFLANNGKVLLLGIESDNTFGDMDIYVSFLKQDQTWSEPMNIGKEINTAFEESTPFLAADGVTLYFASKGYIGYGGQDIYMSKRLDDTWKHWSTPVNLGPHINSEKGDLGFSVSASGKKAFTYSYTDQASNSDIYTIDLAPMVKPEPVVLVKGKVYNAKTKEVIAAKISYENLTNGSELGIAMSDEMVGAYQIVLPKGVSYGVYAEAKGYLSINENIVVPDSNIDFMVVEKDLYLVPIEVGQVYQVNNVLFYQSKADLVETSYSELDRLVKIMKDNESLEIELAGHTDNQGDPQKNILLSKQRVETVKQYLVKNGILETRIQLKAYGGSKPIASNASELTRKLNRRVEVKIIKK